MSETHWKRLINPDYLGAYSLDPGKDMVLTIKSVKREMITGTGGKQEECTVCRWVISHGSGDCVAILSVSTTVF